MVSELTPGWSVLVSSPDCFSSTIASPSLLLQPTADFCHPCTSPKNFHSVLIDSGYHGVHPTPLPLPNMYISMLFLSFQPISGLHTTWLLLFLYFLHTDYINPLPVLNIVSVSYQCAVSISYQLICIYAWFNLLWIVKLNQLVDY